MLLGGTSKKVDYQSKVWTPSPSSWERRLPRKIFKKNLLNHFMSQEIKTCRRVFLLQEEFKANLCPICIPNSRFNWPITYWHTFFQSPEIINAIDAMLQVDLGTPRNCVPFSVMVTTYATIYNTRLTAFWVTKATLQHNPLTAGEAPSLRRDQ